jgi:hypothetical protein
MAIGRLRWGRRRLHVHDVITNGHDHTPIADVPHGETWRKGHAARPSPRPLLADLPPGGSKGQGARRMRSKRAHDWPVFPADGTRGQRGGRIGSFWRSASPILPPTGKPPAAARYSPICHQVAVKDRDRGGCGRTDLLIGRFSQLVEYAANQRAGPGRFGGPLLRYFHPLANGRTPSRKPPAADRNRRRRA